MLSNVHTWSTLIYLWNRCTYLWILHVLIVRCCMWAIHELQYVLQDIIINKIIYNKQLILVFLLHFSVALAQNTMGITTATAMADASRNGFLAPHMMPSAPRRCHEWMGNNPQASGCIFWGGWGCGWPSKHSFFPVMMNCHNIGVFLGPYTPSTPPQNTSPCSGGCCPSIWCISTEHKA